MAVENVDAKGKKKLLAKARIDLVEFATAYKENKFRLKLYPETKKVWLKLLVFGFLKIADTSTLQ